MNQDPVAVLGTTYLGVVVAVYLIPGMIAGIRNHPRKGAIIALNLLLGWTFLGWVAALIWALVKPTPVPVSQTVIYMMPQSDGTTQPVMPPPVLTSAANPYVETWASKVPLWARLVVLAFVAFVLINFARH